MDTNYQPWFYRYPWRCWLQGYLRSRCVWAGQLRSTFQGWNLPRGRTLAGSHLASWSFGYAPGCCFPWVASQRQQQVRLYMKMQLIYHENWTCPITSEKQNNVTKNQHIVIMNAISEITLQVNENRPKWFFSCVRSLEERVVWAMSIKSLRKALVSACKHCVNKIQKAEKNQGVHKSILIYRDNSQ